MRTGASSRVGSYVIMEQTVLNGYPVEPRSAPDRTRRSGGS